MTRPIDKHLDGDELATLVSLRTVGATDSKALPELALGEAQHHVESCDDCYRKVQMQIRVQSKMAGLRTRNAMEPGNECPRDVDWTGVAAGLAPEAKTQELMTHAAQCDHCGPLLRRAADTLTDDATANEEQLLAGFRSAQPEWQKDLAKRLHVSANDEQRNQPALWRRVFLVWPRPVWVAAAFAVVMLGSWVGLRLLHPPSAEQLLAQAYTEHRTLEMRIPGAKFAPMRVERGSGESSLDKPPSLLKAEALIAESLAKNPDDPTWLQARARADLLDGNYESAIQALLRALETRPDSPQLLTDLGSAYFLRAESAGHAIDYGNAIESLGKALAKSPDDPVALFNRGVTCERMFLYAQAVDDWEHYLRVDPQGEWAEDVRKRLGAIKEKLRRHERAQAEPLLTPSEISQAGVNTTVQEEIDGRIEEYQKLAVTDWLPKAFPRYQQASSDVPVFRSALKTLAEISTQKHGDRWLADVLSAAQSPQMPLAFAELASAVLDNDKADTAKAQQSATEGARIFTSSGNEAGAVRARLEYLFAARTVQDGAECLDAASQVSRQPNEHPYIWIQIQLQLEKGSCFRLLENLGTARQQYSDAGHNAEASGYKSIYLRTQDHLAGLDSESGNLQSGWNTVRRALGDFWGRSYPDVRGYNFYYVLHELSQLGNLPHVQIAAWRSGITLTESSPDTAQRAMAHFLMATAADAAEAPDLARQEFARASEVFAASPQIESTQIARLEAEARLASVEARQGDAAGAVTRLVPLEPEIRKLSDNYLAILFYSALGDAELRGGENKEAESTLGSAIALAELQLQSLRDDKSRVEWSEQSSGAYRNFVQFRLNQGDVQGALEIWEWYRGAALRAGKTARSGLGAVGGASPLPEPSEVTAQLSNLTKETIISYAVLPQGLTTWVYDDRGVVAQHTNASPREIEAKILRFRNLCSDPSSDESELKKDSRAMYELLVAPVESYFLPGRALVVELDDRLAGLPFDALLDAQDHYLSERGPIVASLGNYYRAGLRATVPIAADTAALVAAVPAARIATLDLHLSPLPDAIAEGEMVARGLRSARLLAGPEATVSATVSHLRGASVFHFSGHALSSSHRTGLLLSDGLLTTASLSRQNLAQMQLAVFSACDTQSGSSGGVGDPDSLVRTFLRAGVPHVVASRWNVDSTATRFFMEEFYRALLNGMSVAESVRQAQSNLRARPGMAHPYFWAAFAAFGLV